MKFVNLTSHSIDLLPLGISIPHANTPVKVTQNNKLIGVYDDIPVYEIEYCSIAGLPEEKPDTIYIVSAPVLNYVRTVLPHRKDFVSPHKTIKNFERRTVGCSAFRING